MQSKRVPSNGNRRRVPERDIRAVVKQIATQFKPEKIILFGSYAYGNPKPESDVDLMVIGAVGLRAVTKLLSGLSETLGREINPHVLTRGEFALRQRANDHFISSVLTSPRLFIIGSENELTELGK